MKKKFLFTLGIIGLVFLLTACPDLQTPEKEKSDDPNENTNVMIEESAYEVILYLDDMLSEDDSESLAVTTEENLITLTFTNFSYDENNSSQVVSGSIATLYDGLIETKTIDLTFTNDTKLSNITANFSIDWGNMTATGSITINGTSYPAQNYSDYIESIN